MNKSTPSHSYTSTQDETRDDACHEDESMNELGALLGRASEHDIEENTPIQMSNSIIEPETVIKVKPKRRRSTDSESPDPLKSKRLCSTEEDGESFPDVASITKEDGESFPDVASLTKEDGESFPDVASLDIQERRETKRRRNLFGKGE